MRAAEEAEGVVLLSEAGPGTSAGPWHQPDRFLACYTSVGDLLRGQPISSIRVLVVHAHDHPSGSLMVTLGRLGLEYPHMQMVAVLEAEPSLSVAGYLAACGVAIVWPGMQERMRIATGSGCRRRAAPAERGRKPWDMSCS